MQGAFVVERLVNMKFSKRSSRLRNISEYTLKAKTKQGEVVYRIKRLEDKLKFSYNDTEKKSIQSEIESLKKEKETLDKLIANFWFEECQINKKVSETKNQKMLLRNYKMAKKNGLKFSKAPTVETSRSTK